MSSKWFQLAPKSILWGPLVCLTNVEGVGKLKFAYRRRTLFVEKDGKPFIETAGGRELTVNDRLFKAKSQWPRLDRLVSQDASLTFDWTMQASATEFFVGVTSGGNALQRYVVAHDIAQLIRWDTKVRVVSVSEHWDVETMLVCLTYFWAFFEQERTSF